MELTSFLDKLSKVKQSGQGKYMSLDIEKRHNYCREYYRKYRAEHPNMIRQIQKRYRQKPEAKTLINTNAKKYYLALKIKVLTYYGNGKLTCTRCGFDDIRALTIDHINGGGCAERREEKLHGGRAFYLRLRKERFPEGYTTLCANCQMIKESEKKEAI